MSLQPRSPRVRPAFPCLAPPCLSSLLERVCVAVGIVMFLALFAQPLAAAPPDADDWPGWRGPTHDGQAAAGQHVPQTWGDAANVVWTVDVPGRGNGSPTVVGNRGSAGMV